MSITHSSVVKTVMKYQTFLQYLVKRSINVKQTEKENSKF